MQKASLPLALVLLATGCTTVRPAALPPVPVGAGEDLIEHHATARRAYDRCSDAYVEEQMPWQTYLAGGAGALSLGLLGGAAASAFLITDPGTRTGTVAALGVLAGGSLATATFFGMEVPSALERADARSAVLGHALNDTNEALANKDAARMDAISRNLYEDCRAITASRDRTSASNVLKDLARYRRDLEERETDLATLRKTRQDLESTNATLASHVSSKSDEVRLEQTRIQALEERLAEKEAELTSTRSEVRRLEEEQATLSAKQKKLLEEKRKLEEKTGHYEEVASALKQQVEQGKVQLRRLRDGVVVEMQNKVLFPSGSAELNDIGKETLAAVAAAIREMKDRRIRVEGHTDNVPVGKGVPYKDNWELSSARAITVSRFLQENGVDPSILSAEARSEYAPVSSNRSGEGRARNRRIEIYLVPKPLGSKASWKPEG